MKNGEETIGDKSAPIISNISYTPENDTITAMAYIAGNLLNKLWYMEKDSKESMEAERMKREKIDDLIELFKQPLTLRQERFLKNALEKLSEAIRDDKLENINIDDMSLCDIIPKTLLSNNKAHNVTSSDEAKTKHAEKDNRKMIHILNLITKFKDVKQSLKNFEYKRSRNNDSIDDKDHNESMNLFGNVMEKITKLLLPNKHKQRKLSDNLKSLNIFSNDLKIKSKLHDYGFNPKDLKLSVKDKIVVDYLNAIEDKPECLLGKLLQTKHIINHSSNSDIHDNILLNLSEFYKIKSYADLIKLLNPQENYTAQMSSTESEARTDTLNITNNRDNLTNFSNKETKKVILQPVIANKSTKDMLLEHLKALLEDLKQLRDQKGIDTKENFDISQVLPCLYNFMKSAPDDFGANAKELQTPMDRLLSTFNNLKLDMKKDQTRRSEDVNDNLATIPKAILVWDRVIKNLDRASNNTHNRRSLHVASPNDIVNSITALKKVDIVFKTYSNIDKVHPTERMLLLKNILIDLKRYENILVNIDEIVEHNKISDSKRGIINELVEKAIRNVYESEKALQKIIPTKHGIHNDYNKLSLRDMETFEPNRNNFMTNSDLVETNSVKPLKLFKPSDETVNKLIKNRVESLLRTFEDNCESGNGLKCNIAKRILDNLKHGNGALARELYTVLVSDKLVQNLTSIHEVTSKDFLATKLDKLPAANPKVTYFDSEKSKFNSWNPKDSNIMKKLLDGAEVI